MTTKKFGAYTAEISDLEDDRKDCLITGPAGETGSLALAQNTGTLTGRNGEEDVPIPEKVVDQIEAWALAEGY
jgi:hypothetical protein